MLCPISTRSLVLCCLLLIPLVVGCQGCRNEQQAANTPSAPPLVATELKSLPNDEQTSRLLVKPGHWMSVSQGWQSNADDLRGTLTFSPRIGGQSQQNPAVLDSVRPAVLPKGQSKQLDCRVLIPMGLAGERRPVDIQTLFKAGTQAIPKDGGDRLGEAMASHEYFFTVLTKRPEQMTVLQVSDWVRPAQNSFSNEQLIDFRVVFPSGDSRIPVPDTIFEWTSTAYLLWDDATPEQLTLDQRRALRDWVYWGGQLLINGPACAELLIASDLADLMPVESVRGVGIEPAPLIELVNYWSVASDTSSAAVVKQLDDNQDRIGISGKLKANSQEVIGTGGLVLERSVGRGRVVMTRFDLTAGWLLKWDSLQSFYNGVLLLRPTRAYAPSSGEAIMQFADQWQGREHDARLNTRFRLLTRDLNLSLPESSLATPEAVAVINPWLPPNDFFKPGQGVAAWTDSSDASLISLELLRQEAGINIPSVAFVAKSLAIYLFILVPVNYLIFWLLGRLEWAWIMVPIIGLAGAAWIARSAQLDIGFARSKTEIDMLELHAGYQRGHLTRYVALYNSLSTTYNFVFDSQDAVAAPFGVFADSRQSLGNATLRQAFEPNVSLSGFSIPSNQTGTIHAEQIVDVGGSFEFRSVADSSQSATFWSEDGELINQTSLTLYDAVIIGRNGTGTLLYNSLGIVEPSSIKKTKLKQGVGKVADDLPLSVNRLMTPLVDGRSLKPGQLMLVGRLEQILDGIDIAPAVSQSKGQTIVAVHLASGLFPTAGKDINLRKDIKVDDIDDDLEGGAESGM